MRNKCAIYARTDDLSARPCSLADKDLRFFVQHAEVMRVQGEIKEIFILSPDQARGHEIGY